jgi:hypothetical protein
VRLGIGSAAINQATGICAMKITRTALFAVAAIVAISAFGSSTHTSYAGGLGLDWLSNKPYVECIKQARMLADVVAS